MNKKYYVLLDYLKSLESVAVAFSGGVDSALLLYAAKEALGSNAIAITAALKSMPKRELEEAKAFCESYRIKQIICDINELEIEGFSNNPPDRCYLCKKKIFSDLQSLAAQEKMSKLIEGSNLDDDSDYRPGMRAIAELKIESPLKICGFTKKEIRQTLKDLEIDFYAKPAMACLSSRFVYGEEITEEKLRMVDEAEAFLYDIGLKKIRVRVHNNLARIETNPDEFSKILDEEVRKKIYNKLKEIGFLYVTLDLQGYRRGSMNDTIL